MDQQPTRGRGTQRSAFARVVLASSLCSLVFVLPSCGLTTDGSGSNSNWLAPCSGDSECTGGLACLCGLCTKPCDSITSCGDALASSCASLGQSCVNNVGFGVSLCIAQCGGDEDCTAFSDELRCEEGVCRLPSALPDEPDVTIMLPEDGDWVMRGAPATCPLYAAPVSASGDGPWGAMRIESAWVSYTTGSTNPEYMFITTSGRWNQGDLRVGVSISADMTSGAELSSVDGDIEIWFSRYLNGYVDQVEVPGVLQVETYQAPDPIDAGEPMVLRGQIVVDDGTWSLTVPLELTNVCGDLETVIK